MNVQLLLVDDDRAFSAMAAAALQREGHQVTLARSLHEARAACASTSFDLVVLDRRLPDGDGLSFVAELRSGQPTATVLMVTAHGDIASAVDAIRAGASDYLAKPVELADLVLKANRVLADARLRDRLERVEAELSSRRRWVPPRSSRMRAVIEMIERIAASPRSPVLLLGETGAGKEVLARALHDRAVGPEAPFVHVNCAALPEAMVESELFGHERGAFTDARTARRGLVELAHGGTLFLDEIGELPTVLQPKILTFLDQGRFRRLGGSVEHSSSARVVAATNRDLPRAIAAGAFREDLWFRLSVFRIDVPALRERAEDILPLAHGLLDELRGELGRKTARLSRAAEARLQAYPFPGNVRELRNVLERALVLEPGPELELSWLNASTASSGDEFRLSGPPLTLDEVERRYALHVLQRLGGKRVEAARALGISYPTFLKRIGEGSGD